MFCAKINGSRTDDLREIMDSAGPSIRKLAGKTVFISGGAGFLGGYFLGLIQFFNEQTGGKPCRVVCMDNFLTGIPAKIRYHLKHNPGFSFFKGDVCRLTHIPFNVHYMVHAASVASPVRYRRLPLQTMDANVWGLRNMLECARRKRSLESFLFLSSSEVYGDPPDDCVPTPETYRGSVATTGPRACYDESKRFGETMCYNYWKVHKVPVKIVRPFNVFGPGMDPHDGRVIPDFVFSAVRGGPLVMFSDGTPTRSFCYITDAMQGFLRVLCSEYHGEVFNVGNDRGEISVSALAALVNSLAGGGMKVKRKRSVDRDYCTDNPARRCPDVKKIRALLGFRPRVSLTEGLRRMIAYYKERGISGRR